MKAQNNKSGFTLVELMIVAAIIAILAAIIIPLMSQNRISAYASEAQNICGALMTGAKTQFARTGTWPSTVGDLDDSDLQSDAYNTKHWVVAAGTGLGTKAAPTITITEQGTDYSGTISLASDGTWVGTGDFVEISD